MRLRWERKGIIYGAVVSALSILVPWIFQLFIYPDWKNPVNMLNPFGPIFLIFILYWNRWWIIDTFIEQY